MNEARVPLIKGDAPIAPAAALQHSALRSGIMRGNRQAPDASGRDGAWFL